MQLGLHHPLSATTYYSTVYSILLFTILRTTTYAYYSTTGTVLLLGTKTKKRKRAREERDRRKCQRGAAEMPPEKLEAQPPPQGLSLSPTAARGGLAAVPSIRRTAACCAVNYCTGIVSSSFYSSRERETGEFRCTGTA